MKETESSFQIYNSQNLTSKDDHMTYDFSNSLINPLGETTSNNVTDKTNLLRLNFIKAFENPFMGERTGINKNDPNISNFSEELVISQYHRENEGKCLAFSNAVKLKELDISNNPISTFWRPF